MPGYKWVGLGFLLLWFKTDLNRFLYFFFYGNEVHLNFKYILLYCETLLCFRYDSFRPNLNSALHTTIIQSNSKTVGGLFHFTNNSGQFFYTHAPHFLSLFLTLISQVQLSRVTDQISVGTDPAHLVLVCQPTTRWRWQWVAAFRNPGSDTHYSPLYT